MARCPANNCRGGSTAPRCGSPKEAPSIALFGRRANAHPSKKAWDEHTGNLLLVRDPIGAVLGCASVVIPQSSVHQEHSEVYAIKVRHWRIKPCKHTPGDTHEPIAGIIYFSSSSPPSRREELGSSCSWHPLQMGYGTMIWIPPEGIFLAISSPDLTKDMGIRSTKSITKRQGVSHQEQTSLLRTPNNNWEALFSIN